MNLCILLIICVIIVIYIIKKDTNECYKEYGWPDYKYAYYKGAPISGTVYTNNEEENSGLSWIL